jgi:RES domain-containing protein
VDDLGPTSWSGEAYRYTSRGRDPLSGAGARLFGGRWNPRGVYPAVYLAQPLAACVAEFDRMASANGIDALAMLRRPYELHTVTATDLQLLDLREEKALRYVGLTPEDIADDDRTACQAVGHAAWFLQMSGIVAPSATGNGLVIAAFENRLRPGQLRLARTTRLNEGTYARARSSASAASTATPGAPTA